MDENWQLGISFSINCKIGGCVGWGCCSLHFASAAGPGGGVNPSTHGYSDPFPWIAKGGHLSSTACGRGRTNLSRRRPFAPGFPARRRKFMAKKGYIVMCAKCATHEETAEVRSLRVHAKCPRIKIILLILS